MNSRVLKLMNAPYLRQLCHNMREYSACPQSNCLASHVIDIYVFSH